MRDYKDEDMSAFTKMLKDMNSKKNSSNMSAFTKMLNDMNSKKNSSDSSIGGAILVCMVYVGAVAYYMTANAIIVSYFWSWFITPLGVPAIGKLHALGLSTLVSYLTYQHNPWKGEDTRDQKTKITELITLIIRPIVVFIVGAIVYKFSGL